MTTVKGCLLTASRIVIPKSLRHRVLSALHKAHPGQTGMKTIACKKLCPLAYDGFGHRKTHVAGNRPDILDLLSNYHPSNEVHLCLVWKSRDARYGQRNAVHVVSIHFILPFPRNLAHLNAIVPSTKQLTSRTFRGHLQKGTCQAEGG
ncbi:hypothetical protein RB195_003922 [Necator americanus]|uniref:Uncharacterized protein n=1 Tax=Necator americanus TaxID=51031 RepID=A0ABR1DQU2_NECAM